MSARAVKWWVKPLSSVIVYFDEQVDWIRIDVVQEGGIQVILSSPQGILAEAEAESDTLFCKFLVCWLSGAVRRT